MRTISRDLREAVRKLGREPLFAVLAIVTLALGIGATVAMFSVTRAVLLKPLPYADAGRLAMIWDVSDRGGTTWLSRPEIISYRRDLRSFESMGAYTEGDADLTGGNEPERVRAAQTTPSLFSTLGVPPLYGRTFGESDARPGAPRTVLLAHALWQRRYGADPGLVGAQIHVNGTPATVVGVMPEGFVLPLDYVRERPTELWLPFTMDEANPGQWGNRLLLAVGRLRSGVETSAATTEIHLLWRQWIDSGHIAEVATNRSAVPIADLITGPVRTPLLVLLATVVFVLLIVFANVANLWLSKTAGRTRELAVRAALGADRRRLISQMLAESLVLALCGGAAGVALAFVMVRTLSGMHATTLPRIAGASLDPAVLLFALTTSMLAAAAFGLAPALQLSRPALGGILNDATRSITPGRWAQRFRGGLVVVQVALSVVLVLGAGLLTRSLIARQRVTLGYDTSNILTAQVQLPPARYATPADVIRFYRELDGRLRQAPGVRHAGLVRILPLSRTIGNWSIRIEGRTFRPEENPNGDFQYVTPGYFAAMGISALRGRLVETTDTPDRPLAVVINDTMAAKYWPGEEALGKRFHMGTADQPWLTIVGIVPTIRHNTVTEAPRAEMYLPHAQVSLARAGTPRSMTVVMKTDGDPRGSIGYLREAVRGLDADLPISDIRTMEDVEARAFAEPRLTARLLGGFALLALALAAIGLYGTMTLLVHDRAPEIGIRLALGATPSAVVRLVLSSAGRMTAAGVTIGLLGAALLARFLESLLYGVKASDATTFTLAPLVLLVVTLLAGAIPARRASRIDPVRALRG
jgi:putative ABC transport system permease protein